MTNESLLRCSTCLENFDDKHHRPCIGHCGHSVCEKCQARVDTCPLCKQKNAFTETVINYQLLEACDNIRVLMSERKDIKSDIKLPNRSHSNSKKNHFETPNISQQVVNATRRNRKNTSESTADSKQLREIMHNWNSVHSLSSELHRRNRSVRRSSNRMIASDNAPFCQRTFLSIPPENFAAEGIPSAFTRIFFGRSCFEV